MKLLVIKDMSGQEVAVNVDAIRFIRAIDGEPLAKSVIESGDQSRAFFQYTVREIINLISDTDGGSD